ncbi:Blue (Type 1) copper domain protein [Modestobacter italicus]|uniref:Blue (Type 1) copper domain protein n=1 Tax=Modestobacter italicus (strain DSM 44449 / CECT 9708 / BC 501) TaxID=2732864 RepID=I4EVG6_MODI5|nr:plastocyanin/azurin family copper-binding protein [Modestobacter marinus]CCH87379.1 Blue (Type 1) copper domain protein [Modestobacter marinus]
MHAQITRRTVLAGGLAGLAAVALAACGDDPDGGGEAADDEAAPGTVTMGPDGVQQLTVLVGDDYVFVPDSFTVAPGQVRLTLTSNAEQLTHNIRFTPGKGPVDIAEQIPILAPGDSETFDFTAERPGDYQYECSFHVALGQIGTMTVTAG